MSIDFKHNFKIGDAITLNREVILDKLDTLPDWYTDEIFVVVGFDHDCIILNKKLPSKVLANPYIIVYIFVKKAVKYERKIKLEKLNESNL